MEKHPAELLYDKLVELFGTGGDELFVLEWPARVLDETVFAYPVTSVYSELVKPQPVLEEEFRLSDAMLDVAQIVGGPNGSRVSQSFADAINQFVPAYSTAAEEYWRDKETFREWLLEDVTVTIGEDSDAETVTMSRVEVFVYLRDKYVTKLAKWNETKTAKLEDAMHAEDPEDALERYSRWLAEEAPPQEAALEAAYADLVVKGYLHEVQSAIASLDVSTPAEMLETAKARMRSSGMSSLDESETIYPVLFEPADWFKGLSTSFRPVDLLMDPLALQQQLLRKQNQLRSLQDQHTMLQMGQTGNVEDLKKKVANAQIAFGKAETALTDQFAANTLTVAKMYFATTDPSVENLESTGFNEALKAAHVPGLTTEQWADLKSGFVALNAANHDLTSAGRELADLQAALAGAEASDASKQLALLESQMSALKQDIEGIESTLFSPEGREVLAALNTTTDPKKAPEFDPTKDPNWATDSATKEKKYKMIPAAMPAAGQFFDVELTFSSSEESATSSLHQSASSFSWNVDLFFGSAGGSSSSSQADKAQTLDVTKSDIQIGFRAAKVTFDRGGWFDPTIFKASNELHNLPPNKTVSYGTRTDEPDFQKLNSALFPAFPAAFVIVKDVTIKIDLDEEHQASASAVASAASSTSGGCFCFSVSSSSSSSSSSQSSFSSAQGTSVIIKIPGPQILGWFLEYVAKDESTPYQKMPDGFIPSTAKTALIAEETGPLTSRLQASPPDTIGSVPEEAEHLLSSGRRAAVDATT